MKLNTTMRCLRAFRAPMLTRAYSTPSPSTAPPLLQKIRNDLKTALRTKDTVRLSVLRSLLSQTLNASKTSTPINTDIQLLSLLRKNITSAQTAAQEFKDAGREDLVEKEMGQVKVLEEYAGGVEVVGSEEIEKTVKDVVDGGEKKMGEVMKEALKRLEGKNVERGEVARVVKQVLGGAS